MAKTITMPDGEIREGTLPIWKTPWNHNTNLESERTGTYCPEESLTKQEFKEETDINVILQRFMRTGEPPPMPLPEHFTDITGRTSYYEMQSKIATANESFYLLNAQKRAEFQNDPTRWADAVVQAVEYGDRERLGELGIDVPPERPQELAKATPAGGDTPAPKAPPAAPAAPPAGDPKAPTGKQPGDAKD